MALLAGRVVYGGRTPPPGEVVRPDERLSWPRTVGLGAQHVVAMFGATFVFPLVMGLNPQLAIMMSGIATICFLLIVGGRVPSYLGTSASFVGGVVAIRAQGGTSAQVTGAILVAGLVLALAGVVIHYLGSRVLYRVLPPVVTGAVVMLIGFNLAPVVASIYWPQDQWIALLTMLAVMVMAVGFRGFASRIAVFLGLIFGYVLSWLFDRIFGQITAFDPGAGKITTHWRLSWDTVKSAHWLGFPPHTHIGADGKEIVGWHLPDIKITFVLLVLPAVIALIAENTGHVKAVAGMTGADLDPVMGRAIGADGFGTALASLVGGSPKFGAVISATPGGVLGGITVVLYGMIGLLGAKIWKENGVDFGNPINLVPVAAGIIIAIGNTTLKFSDNFQLAGIALGTIVTIGTYHLARAIAPPHLREQQAGEGAVVVVDAPGAYREEPVEEAAPERK